MSRFKYEIKDNVIRAWDLENPNENDAPFLYQPTHPDGTEWTEETAVAWIEALIVELEAPVEAPAEAPTE